MKMSILNLLLTHTGCILSIESNQDQLTLKISKGQTILTKSIPTEKVEANAYNENFDSMVVNLLIREIEGIESAREGTTMTMENLNEKVKYNPYKFKGVDTNEF